MHGRMTVNAVLTRANGMAAVGMAAETGWARIKRRFPVAAQTGRGLARYQEFIIDRPMRIVAGGTAVTHGIVLKNKWPSHFLMTPETHLISVV